MPHVTADDGVKLHYEESGSGRPIVFVHEFAGDCRSYELQLRHFGRAYRCIAYNARGYPPSDVPTELARYSQDRARDDIRAMLDGLGLDKAHIVGISMGAFATLHFGLRYPQRALSLVIGGCGYGAEPDRREKFRQEADAAARRIETQGMVAAAAGYAVGPARVQFQNKDPRGWAEFARMLAEHSALGSAHTLRGVQRERPSLYELSTEMNRLTVPTLVIVGDEDEPALDASLMMKRTIRTAALVLLPNTGHTLNLEEPDLFNRALDDFFQRVEAGRWPLRDPRSLGSGILGMR
ncbi:MAG: alpha/beta hydrolase [Proteobacteria bacterium]|nr:alpha/beta hydrolase [Pseudomonadota bacterium]